MPGFGSYDDLMSEIGAGKRLVCPFSKIHSTAPAATSWYSLWNVTGQPVNGALYTGTDLQFQRLTDASTGALYHGGNKSTDTKHLINAMVSATAGATLPTLMLVDMVGYYPLATGFSGSQQVFDNSSGPNRYTSAGQCGLQAMLVNGALNGSTVNINALNYSDQDGNAAAMPTTPTVAVLGAATLPTTALGSRCLTITSGGMGHPFIPLAAGTMGMRSITNVTASGAMTGLLAFLMVKPLITIPCPIVSGAAERDLAVQISNLERIYDGANLVWLAYFTPATAATFNGSLEVAWG